MTAEIRTEPIDGPSGALLVAELQDDLARRYGSPDRTPVEPTQFAPPSGRFVVAYLDGQPVACGAVRSTPEPGTYELKRMYVAPQARGLGLARQVLAELEGAVRELGGRRLRLETGEKQPEAVRLYESSGYLPIPSFGFYADEPDNRCFAKEL